MFVTRRDANIGGLTLNDPRLKELKIGVQLVGDDASNTPPTHALAARGIIGNVRGYMLYGNYAAPNPPAEVLSAVERGDVDGPPPPGARDALVRRPAVANAVRCLGRRAQRQSEIAQ